MAKTNPAFMSGVPELVVLRLLASKEMYGYELVAAIKVVSAEAISLAEGVIYSSLHSLESKGMLRCRQIQSAGRTRYYYRATAKGKKRLQELLNEWDRVSGGINAIIGDSYA